ncbi:hypothetical protein PVAP13_8KG249803 [Panicum virgatum]|uniref:Uncharacterized protein n=1 Tax=Panicum virgatum TaxID=38727 RepID=A0A8T0PUP5_PANVG|nr:hypothetical protein PVAP13_8KG249803 [Panicum virgatum]
MLCSSLPRRQPLLQLLLYSFSMHVSGKKFLFLFCFSFQIGDILLTSHMARLAAWVALVLIGCITVAGQATSNVMRERVYSPSSSQTRPKQNHVSA